jgi:hypothetical protein
MTGSTRRRFLQWAAGGLLLPREEPTRRHAALYVYTRSLVRPRHEAVVAKAIAQRVQAHTSGWGQQDGTPLQRLGPAKGAGHWKGSRLIKEIWAAWPFAAVLEYSPDDNPKAWIDWLRRRRGAAADSWFYDPPGIYADHINAETVCDADDRWCYMAVVDTPTGSVIGTNEFLVRGRVSRDQSSTAVRGWWVRFETPADQAAEEWTEDLTPLVDWRVDRMQRERGVEATARLDEPTHQLAVWGTRTVFELPSVPAGVRPCGGRR